MCILFHVPGSEGGKKKIGFETIYVFVFFVFFGLRSTLTFYHCIFLIHYFSFRFVPNRQHFFLFCMPPQKVQNVH